MFHFCRKFWALNGAGCFEAHPRSTRFFLRELWDLCQLPGGLADVFGVAGEFDVRSLAQNHGRLAASGLTVQVLGAGHWGRCPGCGAHAAELCEAMPGSVPSHIGRAGHWW